MPQYRVTVKALMAFYTDVIVTADAEDTASDLAERLVAIAINEDGATNLITYDYHTDDHYSVSVDEIQP